MDSASGAAFEAGPWLDEAKKAGHDIKITLVDKAAMDRPSAVAKGLSAINTRTPGHGSAANACPSDRRRGLEESAPCA